MTCRTSTTRWLSACAMLALLAGCSGGGASGPPQTQPRQVGDFHEIELRGAADLVVTVGPTAALTITADPETLEQLRTEVNDGRLVISHDSKLAMVRAGSLRVEASTQRLESLAIAGAGSARITGVQGPLLKLDLSGAGSLVASGETQRLEAEVRGAGEMNLSGLIARDAKVSVNGTGAIKVHATGALEAAVNGVGSITYAGNPQPVNSRINGVGSIQPAAAP